VRNLRAAESGELRLGRRTETFRGRELSDEEKVPALRAYPKRWKVEVGPFFDGSDPTPATFRAACATWRRRPRAARVVPSPARSRRDPPVVPALAGGPAPSVSPMKWIPSSPAAGVVPKGEYRRHLPVVPGLAGNPTETSRTSAPARRGRQILGRQILVTMAVVPLGVLPRSLRTAPAQTGHVATP
jgi:hypothetical protein